MLDDGGRRDRPLLEGIDGRLDPQVSDAEIVLHDRGVDNVLLDIGSDLASRADAEEGEVIGLLVDDRLRGRLERGDVEGDHHVDRLGPQLLGQRPGGLRRFVGERPADYLAADLAEHAHEPGAPLLHVAALRARFHDGQPLAGVAAAHDLLAELDTHGVVVRRDIGLDRGAVDGRFDADHRNVLGDLLDRADQAVAVGGGEDDRVHAAVVFALDQGDLLGEVVLLRQGDEAQVDVHLAGGLVGPLLDALPLLARLAPHDEGDVVDLGDLLLPEHVEGEDREGDRERGQEQHKHENLSLRHFTSPPFTASS